MKHQFIACVEVMLIGVLSLAFLHYRFLMLGDITQLFCSKSYREHTHFISDFIVNTIVLFQTLPLTQSFCSRIYRDHTHFVSDITVNTIILFQILPLTQSFCSRIYRKHNRFVLEVIVNTIVLF